MSQRTNHDDKKRVNFLYAALQSFFWCANCTYFSFLVIYLTSKQFSEFEIGLAMTLLAAVSILSPSILGYISDYVFPVKNIIIFMMMLSIPVAFTLGMSVTLVPVALLSVTLMGITEKSLVSVIDSWGVKIRRGKPYLNYGVSRGIASLSYAVAALSLGQIFNVIGIDNLFWIHAIFAAGCIAAALFLDHVPTLTGQSQKKSYYAAIKQLASNKKYVLLVICMALAGMSFVTSFTFQPILLTQMGGTAFHMGLSLFVMAGSEVPVMFYFSRIAEKYKLVFLLNLAFLFTFFRVIANVLAPNLGWLISVQAIQAFSFGLYLPAVLMYISLITDDHLKGTAITLAVSVGEGFAGIGGNLFGGYLAEKLGVRSVFYLFSLFALAAFLIFLVGNKLIDRMDAKKQTVLLKSEELIQ